MQLKRMCHITVVIDELAGSSDKQKKRSGKKAEK
jgi:hypothetical protein